MIGQVDRSTGAIHPRGIFARLARPSSKRSVFLEVEPCTCSGTLPCEQNGNSAAEKLTEASASSLARIFGKDRAMGRTGYTCIRHVFCSLNVLIWLCACGILGAGLWLRLAYSGYTTLVPHYSFASADSLLLAAGCVTFVIAFFGCCGAWFQSRCMLITYFGLVILMFLAEFMLGTLAFIFREHLAKSLKEELLFGIEKHYNLTREPGTLPAIWDHIHTEFHCCGVRDYTDWFQIDAWPTEDRVPDSCCVQRERYCGRLDSEGRNKAHWYKEGCASAIQMWLVTRLHVVGTVGLVVAFLQLFGQVASMILFCTVRHKRSSHTYKSYDTTNT